MNSPLLPRLLLGLIFLAPVSGQTPDAGVAMATRAFVPVYPYELLVAGKGGGWAEVRFAVDYAGTATFCTIVGSSHIAFGKSLQAEIESVEFIPPRKNGQPLMTSLQERYDFPAEPPLDPISRDVLEELRKPDPMFVKVTQLDAPPVAVRQDPSTYPWALRSDGVAGRAEIEFIIDRNGRALFPRIISATHSDFGWAAATAVSRWRFQPPKQNGQKVDVRLTMPVVFDVSAAEAAW